MRVPLPVSLALILLLALLIQRNHRHLESLRGNQERLAGQARAAGWIVDPQQLADFLDQSFHELLQKLPAAAARAGRRPARKPARKPRRKA